MITSDLRIVFVVITSLFSVLFLIPRLARIATKIGLVDKPSERKVHDESMPLVGGIAMIIAATFSALLFIPLVGLRGLFLGLAVLLLIGFLDDYKEIGHREKFLAQILATAMLMYLSRQYLFSFGDLIGLGNLDLPNHQIVFWLVTIFCVVGVINAVNLMDGLDGLAGGFSFIAFLTFAAHASIVGETTIMLLNLAMVGALLGFLRYNWKPAMVFMGDAGSLCLGFTLAYMSLALTQGDDAKVRPVCALLILAVPIIDTLTVMGKRLVRGQSPFKPDKYHLHHIFIRYGMSKEWSVISILAMSAVFCGVSILGTVYNLPDYYLFSFFALYFAGYIMSSFYIIRIMRLSKRIFRKSSKVFEKSKSKSWIDKISFGDKVGFIPALRKSTRFNVKMKVTHTTEGKDSEVEGRIENISSGGAMLCIPELEGVQSDAVLKVLFTVNDKDHALELPAKHIWYTEKEGSHYHGFEFMDIGSEQEDLIFRFLVKKRK